MRKFFLISLILLCSILFIIKFNNHNKYLLVHVIDVGQGDSTFIATPSGKTILIDGGEDKNYREVLVNIRKNKFNHIDYMISSHSDSDHNGSLDKILKKINTNKIFMPKENTDNKDYLELIYEASNQHKKINRIKKVDKIQIDNDTKIFALSPESIKEKPNDNSLVLLIKYKNQFLLFTGDASKDIESKIITKYRLPKCTFLKVGHHGSKNSSSKEFLDIIKPKISVISCGYMNRHSHPHKETLNRLKNTNTIIYRTDINGDLTFYLDGKNIYAKDTYQTN